MKFSYKVSKYSGKGIRRYQVAVVVVNDLDEVISNHGCLQFDTDEEYNEWKNGLRIPFVSLVEPCEISKLIVLT